MFKIFFLIVCTSLIFSGCDKSPSKEIGYGVLKNGTYSNNFFNMSIKLPSDWVIQSQAAQRKL